MMDVGFWTRSSASAKLCMRSPQSIHIHILPPGALAIDDSDDGLGVDTGVMQRGNWVNVSPGSRSKRSPLSVNESPRSIPVHSPVTTTELINPAKVIDH